MVRPATLCFLVCQRSPTALPALALLCMTVHAAGATHRIFPYQQAEQARHLARQECKPLVIHFIPDTPLGARQLDSFYTGPHRIPEDVVSELVIVVVPTEKYSAFARQLGLTGPGGYRTISAYSLSPIDGQSIPTYRSGFR